MGCYKEEQKQLNNPSLMRLNWEQKRNLKLNDLLIKSVKNYKMW